MIDTSN